MEKMRKFAWSLYVLILACFLMPFATVSCDKQKSFTLSGVQLLKGSTDSIGHMEEKIPPNDVMIAVVALSVTALLCGALVKNNRIRFGTGAAANLISLFMLFLCKVLSDREISSSGHGIVTVVYGAGIWTLLVLLTVSTAVSVYFFINDK
jgi:hypothetical protein